MVTGQTRHEVRDRGSIGGGYAVSWHNAAIEGRVGGWAVMLRKRLVLPRFTFVYMRGVAAEQRGCDATHNYGRVRSRLDASSGRPVAAGRVH